MFEVQVKLVQKSSFTSLKFNLNGETNILYRLITCKIRYFKPLFVIILMIMSYSYEHLFTIC